MVHFVIRLPLRLKWKHKNRKYNTVLKEVTGEKHLASKHAFMTALSVGWGWEESLHSSLKMWNVGPGLKITASQQTMSGLIGTLTGQTFDLPVMLTGQN